MFNLTPLLVIGAIVLSGCTKNNKTGQLVSPMPTAALPGETLWVYRENALVKFETSKNSESETYQIPDDLLPVNFEYGKTFQISQDGQYVVWFVPAKGLVRWSKNDASIKVFYEPTAWFYENPYFKFLGDTQQLLLIDKKGTEVVKINMTDGAVANQVIPYPFGTIFRVSPSLEKILYVEGYQQTTGRPQYLITTASGEEVSRVKTDSEVADRAMVGWTEDSGSIVTVENGSEVVGYPLADSKRNVLYTLPDGERVIEFNQHDHLLFISSRSYWYLIDTKEMKLVRRLPLDAMNQLNKPRFIFSTIATDSFYVEETVKSFEKSFKRLWTSDWIGNKTIVIPQYGVSAAATVTY